MPPTATMNDDSISFFDDGSYQVTSEGIVPVIPVNNTNSPQSKVPINASPPKSPINSSNTIPVPEHAPCESPITPRGVRRGSKPALPKIPRGSLRGNNAAKVKNVKIQSSPVNSPVAAAKNNNPPPIMGCNNNNNSSPGRSVNSGGRSVNSDRSQVKSFVSALAHSSMRRNNYHGPLANKFGYDNTRDRNNTWRSPPTLLPTISASTVGTEDVYLDEDESYDASSRRRSSAGSNALSKSHMQQLLHAPDNDMAMSTMSTLSAGRTVEVDVDELEERSKHSSYYNSPARQPRRMSQNSRRSQHQRRGSSNRSIISGVTFDLVPPHGADVEDVDEEELAQERALALATNMMVKRQQDDDDATINSTRSYSHRSREQYDPDLAFLHSSVIADAMMEKDLSYPGGKEGRSYADDDLLTLAAYGSKKNTRWESCLSKLCPIFLVIMLLGFWGGLIPYCIVRYNQKEGEETVVITEPPEDLIPWTKAPTFAPEPREPTPPPTTIEQNQELLDLLSAPGPATTIEESTNMPVAVTNATTFPPTAAPSTATLAPTTITTVINSTDAPTNTATEATPTAAPTAGAIFTPATSSPTREPTTNTPTFKPSILPNTTAIADFALPSNLNITVPVSTVSTSNTTAAPTAAPTPAAQTSAPTISASPSVSAQPSQEPEVVFPEYTLQAFENPGSPQSKAFSWMLRDPNFGDYSSNRMRQRFALAVFYYSTNGDDWDIQPQVQEPNAPTRQIIQAANTAPVEGRGGLVPWLSYAGHECDWYYMKRPDDGYESTDRSNNNALLQLYSSNMLGVTVCENEYTSDGVIREYKALWLENAGLEGTLPPELAMLTGLKQVQLSDNTLFGTLPAQWFWDDKGTPITWQTSLEQLCLKNNRLQGQIPSEIGLATNLTKIDVQQNRLIRRIPTEIGLLADLEHLLWNNNALTGPIPTEIGVLSSLTACSFNDNALSGTIPTEVGRAQALQEFYVGNNQLYGSIPWELCYLRETLLDLHLFGNQLTHNIPTRLGLLTNLRWLHLGHNELTGRIPWELGTMTMLQLFQIEDNALTGPFPSEHLAAWETVSRVWMYNNPELNGIIPVTWCPSGLLADGTNVSVHNYGSGVDIRVDCEGGGVACPCMEGCSCHDERRRLAKREKQQGLLRGWMEPDTI